MLFDRVRHGTLRLLGSAAIVLLTTLAAPVSAQSSPGAAPPWKWPLEAPREIVRPFIAPATPYAAGHRGIDLAAPEGTPVYSPADGIVYFTGTVVDRPVVSIRHSDELISSFEPVQTTLVAGDVVRRGDAVGRVVLASAQHCVTSCLHFGVRRHGQYVSPMNYLGGIPRSVLLPTRPLR